MASDRIEREQAMIAHDGIYWDHYDRVAGMDEAGRGPADGKEVENQDLWRLMAIVVGKHQVEFVKVPGHADCEENNRCDKLARAEIDKLRKFNPDLHSCGCRK